MTKFIQFLLLARFRYMWQDIEMWSQPNIIDNIPLSKFWGIKAVFHSVNFCTWRFFCQINYGKGNVIQRWTIIHGATYIHLLTVVHASTASPKIIVFWILLWSKSHGEQFSQVERSGRRRILTLFLGRTSYTVVPSMPY